jgi:hypothetical protein
MEGVRMKRTRAILLGWFIVSLALPPAAWGVTTTEGTDGTSGPAGAAQKDATTINASHKTGQVFCSQASRGAVVNLPGGSIITLNACSTSTILSNDIGTAIPQAWAIPVADSNGGLNAWINPLGTTWVSRTPVPNNSASWYGITYNGGRFVSVAYGGSDGLHQVMTSPDGIQWTVRTTSSDINQQWTSVVFGNGVFCAVSQNGSSHQAMSSLDGANWTRQTTPTTTNAWQSVAYGSVYGFVAVASTGTANQVMTSPDCVTWTLGTGIPSAAWNNVWYANNVYVAVGDAGAAMSSPDGTTWTSHSTPAANNWFGLTYGDGLWVSTSTSGMGNRAMTSVDGANWTGQTTPADNNWRALNYGEKTFVAVASGGFPNQVMTSPDGVAWTLRSNPTNHSWTNIQYGNGVFVAVANSTGYDRVMSSGAPVTNYPFVPYAVEHLPYSSKVVAGNYSVTQTDICTTTPGSGVIACTGTDSHISRSFLPVDTSADSSHVVGTDDPRLTDARASTNTLVCGGNIVCSQRTGTGTNTATATVSSLALSANGTAFGTSLATGQITAGAGIQIIKQTGTGTGTATVSSASTTDTITVINTTLAGITGSGTKNYLPKFTTTTTSTATSTETSTAEGNSLIYDNGIAVGVNTTQLCYMGTNTDVCSWNPVIFSLQTYAGKYQMVDGGASSQSWNFVQNNGSGNPIRFAAMNAIMGGSAGSEVGAIRFYAKPSASSVALVGTLNPTNWTMAGSNYFAAQSYQVLGSTSGTVTIQPAATAGTWALTLPTTAGSANQALHTDGTGVASWASDVAANTAITASGATNKLVQYDTKGLVVSGTTAGNAATKDVGTTAGTVAAGDDSRIVSALQALPPPYYTATGNLTGTGTGTATASTTATSTGTLIVTATVTGTATGAGTGTLTGTGTITATGYATLTKTATGTVSVTVTGTGTGTSTTTEVNASIGNASAAPALLSIGNSGQTQFDPSGNEVSSGTINLTGAGTTLAAGINGAKITLNSGTYAPAIGFNATYSGYQMKYGPGSNNQYGMAQLYDQSVGAMNFYTSLTPGYSGMNFTGTLVGQLDRLGDLLLYGALTSTNLTNNGHAIADLLLPAAGVCSAGQVLTYLTTGAPTCVTNGSGTGIGCSGTCSSPSFAVFTDSTHVTNAPYTPLGPNGVNGTHVTAINVSDGLVTSVGSLSSSDVTSALGSVVTAGTYTKLTVNASGLVTNTANIGSSDVTTALGYTPMNVTADHVVNVYSAANAADRSAGVGVCTTLASVSVTSTSTASQFVVNGMLTGHTNSSATYICGLYLSYDSTAIAYGMSSPGNTAPFNISAQGTVTLAAGNHTVYLSLCNLWSGGGLTCYSNKSSNVWEDAQLTVQQWGH